MIYLDNAATTLHKPQTVHEAVSFAMQHCGSLGRSGHGAAELAAELAFSCRSVAGELFSVSPECVVFTMNCTHALNLAIMTLVKPGDRVVVSGYEHNAVLRPLVQRKANIVPVRSELFDQESALEGFRTALTPDTKVAVVSHVSNVFGFIQPINEIAKLCRHRDIPLVIDAAQSAGILPVSMEDTGAAFIAMPGHKALYGPMGTGMLLCGRVPEPVLFGGTGSISKSMEMPEFLPDRAEAGTHNVPGIVGLLEGLRFIQQSGIDRINRHERHLKETMVKRLERIPKLRVFSNRQHQTGVVSVSPETISCEEFGQRLSEKEIAVRAGLHCAPLAHQTVGTLKQGTVRLSLSYFNTMDDIEIVCDTISEILCDC